jgi:lambda repressor-like predicted transcriptional regulator
MNAKERIFSTIKSSIQANNLSIYSLSKTTGINRSTLQKALSGTRPLNVRQFELLLNAVPLTPKENKYLYNNFIEMAVGKERISINKSILEILDTISACLEGSAKSAPPAPPSIKNISSVYSGDSVKDIISFLINSEIEQNDYPKIYTYVPLYTDFFSTLISRYVDYSPKPTKVSVLFEFMKRSGIGIDKNFTTLKNIMPLILSKDNHYNLHYYYVDNFLYDDHITIYPYYIILSDMAILLSYDLSKAAIVSDKSIIDSMISLHLDKLVSASVVTKEVPEPCDIVNSVMSNHIHSDCVYSISYGLCILPYVPPEMYSELVDNAFPNRAEFIRLIHERIEQVANTHINYTLFNKDSISEFAETGNSVILGVGRLRPCTPMQRRIILSNMLKAVNDGKLILRAFSSDKINVSKNFKLINIKGHDCLQILLYPNDSDCRLININEPVTCKGFINFFDDVLESSHTYTSEETVWLLNDAINKLDLLIKKG